MMPPKIKTTVFFLPDERHANYDQQTFVFPIAH